MRVISTGTAGWNPESAMYPSLTLLGASTSKLLVDIEESYWFYAYNCCDLRLLPVLLLVLSAGGSGSCSVEI